VKRRGLIIFVTALIGTSICASLARQPVGRTRPDLAAWFSFDDGPLTFSSVYTSGSVGPFKVGDTHATTVDRLSKVDVLAQDMPQLQQQRPEWRLSLPSQGGGYSTYTVTFTGDRVTAIRSYYSIFAGL
jgi:hypothetical protein